MKYMLTLLFMSFSFINTVYSQKSKFELLKKYVSTYEFNSKRDKVYMLDYEDNLFVYDVNDQTLKQILSDTKFRISNSSKDYNPMYCSKSDILYIIEAGYDYDLFEVYKIKDNKLVEKIDMYTPLKIKELYNNTESLSFKEFQKSCLNKFLSDLDSKSIEHFPGGLFFFSKT